MATPQAPGSLEPGSGSAEPPPATSPSRLPSWLPLWFLAALGVLLVRSLIAASRMDEIELERYGASIAVSKLAGLPLDPSELPIIAHLRGSYLFGLALAPAIAAFGNTLTVVKGLAVLWSALGAALTVALARRTLGVAGGLAALAIFLFAWPSFLKVDVLALGSHADTIPVLMAPLLLLAGAGSRGPGPIRLALFGALLGLGALFSMQFLVALPAILFVLATGPWRGLRPTLLGGLAGALLALPGLIWMKRLSPTTNVVNKSLESRFLPEGVGGALDRAWSFLAGDFFRSWQFDLHGGALFGWLFTISLLAGLLLGFAALRPGTWLSRTQITPWNDRLLGFAVLHLAGFIGAYAITDFRINLDAGADGMGSRYMMPLLPALAVIVAIGARQAAERFGTGLAWILVAPAAVAGAVGFADLFKPWVGAALPPITGSELYEFRDHLSFATLEDYEARLDWIDQLEPSWPEDRPLVYADEFTHPEARGLDAIFRAYRVLPDQPARLHAYQASGLGSAAASQYVRETKWTEPAAARHLGARIQADLARVPEAVRGDHLRGLGRGLCRAQVGSVIQRFFGQPQQNNARDPARLGFNIAAGLDESSRAPFLFGMGFFIGLRSTPYERAQDRIYATLPELSDEILGPWMEGFARGFRFRFVESSYREPGPLQLEQQLAVRERALFRAHLAR